ncbi:hypothetical protein LOAG_12027 [Loa loa]|uniref:Uncharacterized protein n=1 Tax=Loa loa TaxID=7209 RepID=A0A1S0TM23_LOALO|nr:hypothetical protein LOAG_12027 [Loa loa]EFO16481.1 hypothetical protein LOAG_12027 [Loa loa]
MASSHYLEFGREPGINGNSIYFTTAEDFSGSTVTSGQVKQMDEGKVTSSITNDTTIKSDDYCKLNISNDSNIFIPTKGTNCAARIGRKAIIRDETTEGKDKNVRKQQIVSMYATPALNNCRDIIDGNWQNDDEGMNKFKNKQELKLLEQKE